MYTYKKKKGKTFLKIKMLNFIYFFFFIIEIFKELTIAARRIMVIYTSNGLQHF